MTNMIDPTFEREKQPWKRARKLEESKAAEFLTLQDVYNKTMALDNPRDRALVALLYLTAARIEEIVRHTPRKYGKKRIPNTQKFVQNYAEIKRGSMKESLKREDITLETYDEKRYLILRIRNLKNKKNRTKLQPIPIDNQTYGMFIPLLRTHIESLYDWEELFPFGSRRAQQILSKIGFNPHFLRKLRLTHLVKYHDFNEPKLVAFAGWTDSRPAKHYVRLRWEDLVKSM